MNHYKEILLAANVPCVLCLLLAGYLALNGRDGWGWFLFASLLLSTSRVRFSGDLKEKEEVEVESDNL